MTESSFHVSRYAAVRLSVTAGPLYAIRHFPVTSVKPNPLAWSHALKLAGGEVSRLLVLDERTIIVTNQSRLIRRRGA